MAIPNKEFEDIKNQIKKFVDEEIAVDEKEFSNMPVSYTHLTLPTICSV